MEKWDKNGLIPLIFQRVEESVPNPVFVYNTFIDFMYHISIPQDGIDFVKEHANVLTEIYKAKIELPRIYRGENRICFPDYSMPYDSHNELSQKVPVCLEHMSNHINRIKRLVKQLSMQLFNAMNKLEREMKDQRRSRQRDLTKRML